MLIAELAALTDTTPRALRFYEEQGLLAAGRTPAGYRTYPQEAATRVRNIRNLLASGFTVDDVRAFLPYLDDEHVPDVFPFSPACTDGYAAVGATRVAELEERIAALTVLRDRLLRRMPWLADPSGSAATPGRSAG